MTAVAPRRKSGPVGNGKEYWLMGYSSKHYGGYLLLCNETGRVVTRGDIHCLVFHPRSFKRNAQHADEDEDDDMEDHDREYQVVEVESDDSEQLDNHVPSPPPHFESSSPSVESVSPPVEHVSPQGGSPPPRSVEGGVRLINNPLGVVTGRGSSPK